MRKELQRHRTIRLNDSRWAKFLRIGGMDWLRKKIDVAREPKRD